MPPEKSGANAPSAIVAELLAAVQKVFWCQLLATHAEKLPRGNKISRSDSATQAAREQHRLRSVVIIATTLPPKSDRSRQFLPALEWFATPGS